MVVRGFLSLLCTRTLTATYDPNNRLQNPRRCSGTGVGNPLFAVCHPGEKGHRGGYIAHLRLLCKEAS